MKKELGIYLHIPFCKQKCYYCDFVSYADKLLYMHPKAIIENREIVFIDQD